MIKNSRSKKLVASLIAVCMLGETTLFAAGTAGQFFTDIFGETMYSNITTGGFFEHKNADGSTSEYSAYIPGDSVRHLMSQNLFFPYHSQALAWDAEALVSKVCL